MERSILELKEEIADLEHGIKVFERRIEQARWLSVMLNRAKAPHPRFTYWEWEYKNFPTEAVRLRVNRVVGELYARMIGKWEPNPESNKDIPGVPSELLYIQRPPTVAEVYKLVKAAAGFSSNAKVVEMFQVMKVNGYPDELTTFVLSAVDT